MNELISIIVPIYNVEQYLERCIDSILNQSYQNLEIILVNDGSEDHCPQMCDRYQEKDKRIVVIHKINGGVSDARNYGIDMAKGKYIMFVDGDDYIEATMVEKLYEVQRETNADIVQCGYNVIYNNGKKSREVTQNYSEYSKSDDGKMFFYLHNLELCVVPWNKLIRPEAIRKIQFPLNRRYEDEAVMYKVFDSAKKVVNVECPMYNYMQNESGFMNEAENVKKLSDLVKAKEELYLYIVKKYSNLCEKAERDFLQILFINNIKALKCDLKDKNERNEFYQIRNKLAEYYRKMKMQKNIKNSTLFILRYFPFLIKLKQKLPQ